MLIAARGEQLQPALHDRVEHGLGVGERIADHPQHLRGRRLLLQRLRHLPRARLHLLEQPHVLDRDHGLLGEAREERDLLVRERPHLAAVDREGPEKASLLEQGHSKPGARPKSLDGPDPHRVAGPVKVVDDIVDVHDPLLARDLPEAGVRSRPHRLIAEHRSG